MQDVDAQHTIKSAATAPNDYTVAVARLWLTAGAYRSYSFALNDAGRLILKWRFKEGSTALSTPLRAVAEELRVSIETNEPKVRLQSSSGKGDIVLDVVPGVLREIWLVNMPLLDILADRRNPNNWRDPDHHYHHFYDLSAHPNPNAVKYIPHPEPKGTDCGPPAIGAGGGPKCPPTYFG
jgi:Zn-finger nucleic acid-binding protein